MTAKQQQVAYTSRREDDGSWSVIDPYTGEVAIVSYGVVLNRLDEAMCLDIVYSLNEFYKMQSRSQ